MRRSFWFAFGLLHLACSGGEKTMPQQQPLENGRCRAATDCGQQDDCLRPDRAELCGSDGCPSNECNAAIDCMNKGAGYVCENFNGIRLCVPPCSTAQPCSAHEQCNTDGLCENKSCANASDCPNDFDCIGTSCQRRFCQDDSLCSGFCVLGSCYAEAGSCSPSS
jgi:hypothetical protein